MTEKIKKLIPLKYFLPEISPYRPLKMSCQVCQTESVFSGHMRLNTSDGCLYYWSYQCQDCGKLSNSDEATDQKITVGLSQPCDCGGQFRRDKNIFCTSCGYRKSEENKSEENLFASQEQMEELKKSHDLEEMQLPFLKSEYFEFIKE